MLDNDRQELIATRLSQKNAMQPCQRCLSEHFEILAEVEMPLIANICPVCLNPLLTPYPSFLSRAKVVGTCSSMSEPCWGCRSKLIFWDTCSARVREGGSMLPNIPIATDNIYKFAALFGLLSI